MSVDNTAFVNRLRKNRRTLGRWARREQISCYRVYDADIPEFAVAVDLYETTLGRALHMQEYAPPKSIDPALAAARLDAATAGAAEVLEVPRERVFVKVRERQRGASQYRRRADPGARGTMYEVREGPCRLLVNFTDYLDTGLFLDHRITRARLGELALGKRVLNLFAYTASASVHAGLRGASATVSVDLSRTYCGWARENLALNELAPSRHEVVRADVLEFLRHAPAGDFELAFVDPPTFSNSKSTRADLEVQRDHVKLILGTLRLLTPGGALIFSCNRRRFTLDEDALRSARPELTIEDITRATIPKDFARNPRIHHCWILRR